MLNPAELLYYTLAPQMAAAQQRISEDAVRLVHYTTGENALKILTSGEFWLRNVRCMNDYMEVDHGRDLLLRTFHADESARRDRMIRVLDAAVPGGAQAAIESFDQWINRLRHDTFIGCLSEHDASSSYGRLSMWRAYSGLQSGVALIMNKTPFIANTDVLKAYSTPAVYMSDAQFGLHIDNALNELEQHTSVLSALSADELQYTLFWWLTFTAVSLKHPGFEEEREWRIVYIPAMERSEHIKESFECVRGIPQIVQKIPLEDEPAKGLYGADPNSLICQVIIGPTEYPLDVRDALIAAMRQAGVHDAESKIAFSGIPVRGP